MTQAQATRGSEVLRVVPSPKWVRVFFGGEAVADSKQAKLLCGNRIPVYYFPESDVRMELLEPTDHTADISGVGGASYRNLRVGDRAAEDAVWGLVKPAGEISGLKGHLAFEWSKMDAWFEEDEEVLVHARDPFKRVDIMPSSRHVRVVVGGETVAESRNPSILFETGMPTRYYLPMVDVRMELLRPSESVTRCPYKGEAHYYSVAVGGQAHQDIAWYYRYPIPEASKVAGMVCFFNERVDALYVDDELMPKPRTPWS